MSNMSAGERARLFNALFHIVFYGRVDKLPWAALKAEFGEAAVQEWVKTDDLALFSRLDVAEALLRFRNGHDLPANVGTRGDCVALCDLLGITPRDCGSYEP